jgi:hypothetical protein
MPFGKSKLFSTLASIENFPIYLKLLLADFKIQYDSLKAENSKVVLPFNFKRELLG